MQEVEVEYYAHKMMKGNMNQAETKNKSESRAEI